MNQLCKIMIILFLCITTTALAAENQDVSHASPAPLFDGLGRFHYAIETKSDLAQRYFDQGLLLFYGFDFDESIRSFQAASKIDPNCPMCYWGLALAIGSKTNTVITGSEHHDAIVAIDKAKQLNEHHHARASETALIQALAKRYHKNMFSKKNQSPESIYKHMNTIVSDKESEDFSQAMYAVAKQFPNNPTVLSTYAWALFSVSKWHFWDKENHPTQYTNELIRVLEHILDQNPNHPGANHYYIHTLERSNQLHKALRSADILPVKFPGMEHLAHMASHIYLFMGKYHAATDANIQATAAFKRYHRQCRQQKFKSSTNFLEQHNWQFLWTAAAMEGREHLAHNAVIHLVKLSSSSMLAKEPGMQRFLVMPYMHAVYFHRWNHILGFKKPARENQFQLALWYFAQGEAHAHTKMLSKAIQAHQHLKTFADLGPIDDNLGERGYQQLVLAEMILAADIEHLKHNNTSMLKRWQAAKKYQQSIGFYEPPLWYFLVQDGLGEAYFIKGDYDKSVKAYKEYLNTFPENGWALYGLHRSLLASELFNDAEKAKQRFTQAWRYADIILPLS